jgi:hypothetical protein
MGDIDGDGDVDGNDLVQWMLSFGGSLAGSSAFAAVPAALQESRTGEMGLAAISEFDQSELDGRVGPGSPVVLSRARDAIRFELALGQESDTLSHPFAVSSVEPATGDQSPPPHSNTAGFIAAKDAFIASLGAEKGERVAQALKPFASNLRRLAPYEVDSAIAAGLRDENDWLA